MFVELAGKEAEPEIVVNAGGGKASGQFQAVAKTKDAQWCSRWYTDLAEAKKLCMHLGALRNHGATFMIYDKWHQQEWNYSRVAYKQIYTKETLQRIQLSQSFKGVASNARSPFTWLNGMFGDASPMPAAMMFGEFGISDCAVESLNLKHNPEAFFFKTMKASHMNDTRTWVNVGDTWMREAIRCKRQECRLAGKLDRAEATYLLVSNIINNQ